MFLCWGWGGARREVWNSCGSKILQNFSAAIFVDCGSPGNATIFNKQNGGMNLLGHDNTLFVKNGETCYHQAIKNGVFPGLPVLWILLDDLIETVDGSEVLYCLILLMEEILHYLGCKKNPVKNGMNCQAQVVQPPDFRTITRKLGETIWLTPWIPWWRNASFNLGL